MPGDRRALADLVEQRVGTIIEPYRAALLEVDRADFVRREDVARAWIDEPLPLDTPHGKGVATVSAPHMYVLGFDALGLRAGDHLLELGSGSGYGAALASYVVGRDGLVTTVETDPHLARIALRTTARLPNVKVIHDDGLRRGDLLAAHPKCWLTFSVTEEPRELLDHLLEGSVLVAPVGPPHDQKLLRYRRHEGSLRVEDLGAVRFVGARPLIED
jgi:protein-L-isoaspartate(D-aspartate) O-methyltransferase